MPLSTVLSKCMCDVYSTCYSNSYIAERYARLLLIIFGPSGSDRTNYGIRTFKYPS